MVIAHRGHYQNWGHISPNIPTDASFSQTKQFSFKEIFCENFGFSKNNRNFVEPAIQLVCV